MRTKLLAVAGFTNLVFALFQSSLAFLGSHVSRYLGAPRWALATLERGGMLLVVMIGVAAGLSVVSGLYSLSGAGVLRRLPGLRVVLFVLGTGYALWGIRII